MIMNDIVSEKGMSDVSTHISVNKGCSHAEAQQQARVCAVSCFLISGLGRLTIEALRGRGSSFETDNFE